MQQHQRLQPLDYTSKAHMMTKIFILINLIRLLLFGGVLEYDYRLERVAEIRAEQIKNSGILAHLSGKEYHQLLVGEGIEYLNMGENISYGYDEETAIKKFMSSKTHRNNILGKYNKIGVYITQFKKKKLIIIIFLRDEEYK